MTVIDEWLAGKSILDSQTVRDANRISGCGWDVTMLEDRFRDYFLNHGRHDEWHSFFDVCNDNKVQAYRMWGKGVVTLLKAGLHEVLEFDSSKVRVRQTPLPPAPTEPKAIELQPKIDEKDEDLPVT